MDRVVWKYSSNNRDRKREWLYYYFPISNDYYKTNISKSKTIGNTSEHWEEEAVESTSKNIHSDALLNVIALVIFIIISGKWAYISAINYGWFSFLSFVCISLPVASVFFDQAIFSWIKYLEKKIKFTKKN